MILSKTSLKAIEAYGGIELWKNSKYLEAEVSVRGLLFTLKQRPFFDHATIRMEIGRPFSEISPIGKDRNITGVLDGNDVRLENSSGEVIAERKNARQYFPYGRRLLHWDDMDMAYFANYAFWNYFTFPNLLMNPQIKWIEKEDGILEATYPDTIPVHSKVQDFRIDMTTGLLIQQNYTAEVVSKLATAANLVTEHSEEKGLIYPSRRLITPKSKSGKALKIPVLVDIKVHRFRLTNEEIMEYNLD
jgi:hypothetical protein